MSAGEDLLAFQLRAYKIPHEREFRFHPTRKWRFDFLITGTKLAIEIDGGVWKGGRHNRPAGFIKDMEKMNEAAKLGYSVLRFTPQQVKSGFAIEAIKEMINANP